MGVRTVPFNAERTVLFYFSSRKLKTHRHRCDISFCIPCRGPGFAALFPSPVKKRMLRLTYANEKRKAGLFRRFALRPSFFPMEPVMSDLVRFGVSLERDLLAAFDELSQERGFTNRSEALRHALRRELAEKITSAPDAPVAGVLTLVYDHHENDLPGRLTALQHEAHGDHVMLHGHHGVVGAQPVMAGVADGGKACP